MELNKLVYHLNNSDSEDMSSDSSSDQCNYCQYDSSSDTSTESFPTKRKLHRITSYMETVESYDSDEFKEHFRLKRTTCQFIIDNVNHHMVLPQHKFGREKITADKAVYMTIWYLANTESFRQISDRFNITKSSAYRVIRKIVNYLVKQSSNFIVWPNQQKRLQIKSEFKKLKGISGIVGCIDGSHINIKRPSSKHAHAYYNRKGDYSILLQAVCDNEKRFIDIFCGEPGSMHDSRLLKKSLLYQKSIDGFMENDFLLGDSAYPCMNWLIPPFKDNGNLYQNQKYFNYRHSSSRIAIENAFGLLKGRFRRLKMFENNNIIFIVKCVVAATVLHNICINFDDEVEPDDLTPSEEFDENTIRNICGITPQYMKREEIFRRMFGI